MKKFISEVLWGPMQRLWQDLYGLMNNVMVMVLILLLGWIMSRVVRWLLQGFLRLVHFDHLAHRVGFSEALSRAGIRREPAAVVSGVVYYMLFALEFPAINAFIVQLFEYLPRLAAALLILFAGHLLSAFINRTVLIAAVNANLQFARPLAAAAQALIFVFFLAISLEQAGIGQGIVIATFSILFGGAVLALAIAFGFGGRDLARDILERHFRKP
jgi:hypothetical protein